MAESIQWNSLTWSEGDDFLHFAFGAFNSKSFSSGGTIYRTSDSNRYNIHLAPPMQDITAEVPGGDGQYYFGTYHKPKVIDVSFAFEGLTKNEIQGLKRAFTGKELKELAFSEDVTYEEGNVNDFRIYTAKVTGQPSLKVLAFGDGANERYNGEGTIQFTAYWPYCRGPYQQGTSQMTNNGDAPTSIVATGSLSAASIDGDTLVTFSSGAGYWNSATGIVKTSNASNGVVVNYGGRGAVWVQPGQTISVSGATKIEYCYWYY